MICEGSPTSPKPWPRWVQFSYLYIYIQRYMYTVYVCFDLSPIYFRTYIYLSTYTWSVCLYTSIYPIYPYHHHSHLLIDRFLSTYTWGPFFIYVKQVWDLYLHPRGFQLAKGLFTRIVSITASWEYRMLGSKCWEFDPDLRIFIRGEHQHQVHLCGAQQHQVHLCGGHQHQVHLCGGHREAGEDCWFLRTNMQSFIH